ncbi:hypothetical protein PMHK_03390 [Pseudomonas sp. MHK4]
MPAKAPGQSASMPAVRPLSLASQLLQGALPGTDFVYDASDGGRKTNAMFQDAFASKSGPAR